MLIVCGDGEPESYGQLRRRQPTGKLELQLTSRRDDLAGLKENGRPGTAIKRPVGAEAEGFRTDTSGGTFASWTFG